jgi:hypothetical protein
MIPLNTEVRRVPLTNLAVTMNFATALMTSRNTVGRANSNHPTVLTMNSVAILMTSRNTVGRRVDIQWW